VSDLLAHAGVAAVAGILVGSIFIPFVRSRKWRKEARVDTPAMHQEKAGTPGMGGVILLAALIAGSCWTMTPTVRVLLLTAILFSGLGFLDDYQKATGRSGYGLKARHKLAVQIAFAAAVWSMAYRIHPSPGAWTIDRVGSIWLLSAYHVVNVLLIVGMSNAANITDGLDGLAAGVATLSFLPFIAIAVDQGRSDVAYFVAAYVGAAIAFLWFNRPRARIWMGDTGSLALGAVLTMVALVTHTERWLLWFGLVFALDALTVILQVVSFQTTGHRIFRMAPIHHAFELRGWSEVQIVITGWLLQACASGVGLWLYHTSHMRM